MPARVVRSIVLISYLALAFPVVGQEKLDHDGDPLPKHTVARMGSLRWRTPIPLVLYTLAADGKRLLTVDYFGKVRWLDEATGKVVGQAQLHAPAAAAKNTAMAVSYPVANDRQSMLAGLDLVGKLHLWRIDTGELLANLPTVEWMYAISAFSPDGKVLTAVGVSKKRNLELLVADTENSKGKVHVLAEHDPTSKISPQTPGFLTWSADGKSLLLGKYEFSANPKEWEFSVTKLDQATGKVGERLASVEDALDPRIAPDRKLAALLGENAIHVLDLATGKERKLKGAPAQSRAPLFCADGKKLATFDSLNKGLTIWNVVAGEKVRQLDKVMHETAMTAHTFSSDGNSIFYTAPWVLHRIDIESGKELNKLSGHVRDVIDLNFSPDGKILVTQAEDMTIRRWDTATGKELGQVSMPENIRKSFFLLSPDFQTLLTADRDGSLRIRDPKTFELRHAVQDTKRGEPDRTVVFSPDSKLAAVLDGSGRKARVYQVAEAKLLHRLELPAAEDKNNPSRALQFSADGTKLATVTTAAQVQVWDMANGKETQRIDISGEPALRRIAFSPDGSTLALDYYEGTTVLWDLANNKREAVFAEKAAAGSVPMTTRAAHGADYAYPIAFAPNGKWLAKAGLDGKVHLWDVAGRKKITELEGHRGAVVSVAFSPDSTRLASSGIDTTVLLWDIAAATKPR